MKQCDPCGKEIPEEYLNLLCDECYHKLEIENERLKGLAEEDKFKQEAIETVVVSPLEVIPEEQKLHDPIISDPAYIENPEKEDKPQWEANLQCFLKTGVFLWHPTRDMYTFIKDYCMTKVLAHPQYPKYIWRPKIVDVGCGTGVGSNILSQEADFVWGIDKNEKTVALAKQLFTRVKNGIYYSGECQFDCIDFIKDNRTFMKFDVVVSIEVFEHIDDWRTFLTNLIQRFDNRSAEVPTEYFLSTPNRNNRHIRKEKPYNPFHVREVTQEEFHAALSQYFNKIEFFNSKGEPVGDRNDHTPLLAKASGPKI
ncbi:class I SAM-dependent methyltransferase [Candidatus Roizmanbacteria bacterium]|nr:class I SAM-dependent methyltransferase [Candidatus Roizmanbacteria bacterium]